jgi:hypothetical protein
VVGETRGYRAQAFSIPKNKTAEDVFFRRFDYLTEAY